MKCTLEPRNLKTRKGNNPRPSPKEPREIVSIMIGSIIIISISIAVLGETGCLTFVYSNDTVVLVVLAV